ncbi:MarR family winged helix-turn-helix transcriptional regulator [Streptomyces sp. NPDC045470]|uniref:MarR family winged helix-turn-helix transcriptional regulator n=1 Tax=Streptomyces sp. NPDC045470 TaxID=3155469 RepID=UPI0033E7FB4D
MGRARGEYGPVELLQALAESSPARVGDLAARRRLAFSTVSGLITQVINAGLVSRPTVPSDRRASAVALRSVTVLRGADRPAPGGPARRSDLDAWRCAAASSGSFVLCTAHSGGPRQRFATLTTRSTDAMSAGAVSAYGPCVRQPLAAHSPDRTLEPPAESRISSVTQRMPGIAVIPARERHPPATLLLSG